MWKDLSMSLNFKINFKFIDMLFEPKIRVLRISSRFKIRDLKTMGGWNFKIRASGLFKKWKGGEQEWFHAGWKCRNMQQLDIPWGRAESWAACFFVYWKWPRDGWCSQSSSVVSFFRPYPFSLLSLAVDQSQQRRNAWNCWRVSFLILYIWGVWSGVRASVESSSLVVKSVAGM